MASAIGSPTAEKTLFERTRLRLALWYTGAMGAIVLAAACGFYLFFGEQQLSEVDRDLENLSQTLASSLEVGDGDADDLLVMRRRFERAPFAAEAQSGDFPAGYVRWYDFEGRLRLSFGQTPGHPPAPVLTQNLRTVSGRPDYRERTVPLVVEATTMGYLQVGLSLAPAQQRLHRVGVTLLVGVPLTLATVGLVGWWLAGLAIVPIEQSYTRLQQFTADAGHELRTPLAAIRANAQAALKQGVAADPLRTEERLRAIDRAGERLGTLVTDLLFLARSDHRQSGGSPQPFCGLGEILADLSEELAPVALAAGVGLYYRPPGETQVGLMADSDQIYRLFTNLITNAIKYTPSGGRVDIELQQASPRQALVTVRDTGIGIPPEHQAHIFERFYRVDTARSRAVGGNGLGLAICRAIVLAHGGSLELAESSPAGSTFAVRLPIAPLAAPAANLAPSAGT
ncbi:sensor histidine kinase [Gloeobacter kilaueensis]|uniref:histidine kinase n=1 Tax=Gloeobacter kilaueensis (strain ATCC BAA-2537 / CCAP 1431/1 / ULC 316 / JS1) TaxID=1183438 RepID=U5QM12_GLOK1|nr:ATP-binding protein [Gloeobacter kilaueensis]AGY60022.1 two-component sensor histidine kinase [Gloeobacter kilaueensis JS1]